MEVGVRIFKQIFLALALLSAGQVQAAPEVGKDYQIVNSPQPTASGDKIEVLEFFYYPCSHCYKLDSFLGAWEKKMPKDVQFIYESTIFSDNMEPMARAFYALESIKQRKRLHETLFKAIHDEKLELYDEVALTDYVVKHGVNREKFSAAYNSPLIQAKVAHSRQLAVDYNIRGTPTLIVDGRYMIFGLPPKETIQVLNFIVSKVRKERTSKKS